CALFAASLLCLLCLTVSAADDVPLPPVADLEEQVDSYIKELDKSLEDLAASRDFASDANVLARDANTLIIIALALGMSEENGKYKAAAPEIIKAAQTVAAAKDLAAAKAGLAAVKAALEKKSTDKLEWKKMAKMEPVMKLAVPRINTGMTRYIRTEATLKRGIPNVAGATAALAVIAQGLKPNFDETIKPDNEDDWVRLSRDFRDLALKANAAIHGFEKGDVSFDDFKAVLTTMKESCEHCHAVFTEGAIAVD
ncbi:MAG: hypothetical protein FWH27_18995, partial [Planctomycetaceae bacterium]|nr:hypothetical protein [Planctomycetaceae bacterium]